MTEQKGSIRTSPVSLVSLISGIVNITCCYGLLFLVPLITGYLGYKKIKEGADESKGIPITGLVLGGLGLLWFIVAIVIWIIYGALIMTQLNR